MDRSSANERHPSIVPDLHQDQDQTGDQPVLHQAEEVAASSLDQRRSPSSSSDTSPPIEQCAFMGLDAHSQSPSLFGETAGNPEITHPTAAQRAERRAAADERRDAERRAFVIAADERRDNERRAFEAAAAASAAADEAERRAFEVAEEERRALELSEEEEARQEEQDRETARREGVAAEARTAAAREDTDENDRLRREGEHKLAQQLKELQTQAVEVISKLQEDLKVTNTRLIESEHKVSEAVAKEADQALMEEKMWRKIGRREGTIEDLTKKYDDCVQRECAAAHTATEMEDKFTAYKESELLLQQEVARATEEIKKQNTLIKNMEEEASAATIWRLDSETTINNLKVKIGVEMAHNETLIRGLAQYRLPKPANSLGALSDIVRMPKPAGSLDTLSVITGMPKPAN